MALFECKKSGSNYPQLTYIPTNNGSNTTINCKVGDYLITMAFSTSSNLFSVISGGTVVTIDSSGICLVQCTDTELVIKWNGASYNSAHSILVSGLSGITTLTRCDSGFENTPKKTVFFAIGDMGTSIYSYYLQNTIISASGTGAVGPIAGYTTDSTNKIVIAGTRQKGCYLS